MRNHSSCFWSCAGSRFKLDEQLVRKGVHAHSFAYTCPHARRQPAKIKAISDSIAYSRLMPCLPRSRLFVYPRGKHDSALSTCASLRPFLDPHFSLFREWMLPFFASQRENVFLRTSISDNLSDFRFRIFLTVTLVFDSLQSRSICQFFVLPTVYRRYCKIIRNVAKTLIINYIKNIKKSQLEAESLFGSL